MLTGYLKEEGCDKAYKAFLSESPHLTEYAHLLKRGSEYPTSVNGKTLKEMVHFYGQLNSKGNFIHNCFIPLIISRLKKKEESKLQMC